MSTETNKAIAYFTHKGEAYKIHERSNPLHDGTRCTRRFIVRRSDDRWSGEASNVREARRVLDDREKKDAAPGSTTSRERFREAARRAFDGNGTFETYVSP